MVYRFMKENQGQYTIQWGKQGTSSRREEDAELVRLIREILEQHHDRYGCPRVREILRREHGKPVSRKKVAVAASLPLMREHGLHAHRRRKFIPRTNSNHGFPVGENLLNREFHAEGGGQKWESSYRRYAST